MKRIHFEIHINALRRNVWNAMLEPDTYNQWTAEFTEGSHYKGSWEQGAHIRFLDPAGNGMVAVIDRNVPFEHISVKHIGMMKNGVEDVDSEEVRRWTPAFENYSFFDSGNGTRLQIEMDVTPEFESYMQTAWPKALARLKSICEAS